MLAEHHQWALPEQLHQQGNLHEQRHLEEQPHLWGQQHLTGQLQRPSVELHPWVLSEQLQQQGSLDEQPHPKDMQYLKELQRTPAEPSCHRLAPGEATHCGESCCVVTASFVRLAPLLSPSGQVAAMLPAALDVCSIGDR